MDEWWVGGWMVDRWMNGWMVDGEWIEWWVGGWIDGA